MWVTSGSTVMTGNMFWWATLCLLLALDEKVMSQDEPAESKEYCPPLTNQSVRITCETSTEATSCSEPLFGHKARVLWSKSVIKSGRRTGDLVCDPSGVWKRFSRTSGDGPPPGYVTLPGMGSYRLVTKPLNWKVANKSCNDDGGHLLIIDSEAEKNAIKQFIQPSLQDVTTLGLLYGVHTNNEGQFKTVLGDAFPEDSSIVKWGSNEPTRGSETCVFINPITFLAHDIPEGYGAGYVCELPLRK